MLATSPHATSAFELSNGSQKWTSSQPIARRRTGFKPVASAARPLLVGDRIIVRREAPPGASLVSLDRQSGQTVWQSRLASQETVVSDPVAIGNEIVACVAPREERQTATTLALAAFDSASGEVRWRRPLVRLRDSWWSQPVCQVAVDGDTLFVALGGAILACETSGRVKWLRRADRVPAAVDGWSLLQAHDQPEWCADRKVSGPGVRTAALGAGFP
jgi:outer membrane protein assembly factor BamB